jgi:hypothetical protein
MTPMPRRFALAAGILVAIGAHGACGEPPPGRTYYERHVEPILIQSCAGNTGGCHRTASGDPFGRAAGNFDVSSFDRVQKRRDLLEPYGPYQVAPLLIKAVGPGVLSVAYNDRFIDLDIPHAGGANLELGRDAYLTLHTWIVNGATENGLAPPSPPRDDAQPCSTAIPPEFDPAPHRSHPAFARFVADVQPILRGQGCSSGNCHGAPLADFYVTCGDTDDQRAFNFAQAWAFVDDPVDESQLLQVPLAVGAGGLHHTGGDRFASRSEAAYAAIRGWAAEVGRIEFGDGDPGREFFADHVQPLLISRGCAFAACHSPAAGNDFKLSAGSQGFFSAISLERNYQLLRDEFMALEYPDARRGRAVAKGIFRADGGIAHRGGFVLETVGGGAPDPATCPAVYDAATATAFCTMQRWLDLERARLGAQVMPLGDGDTVPIVYVQRQAGHVATPLEIGTYQPGADLLVATATLGAGGAIVSVGAAASLLDGCAGAADRAAVDVRAPDVRHDGDRIAFAMRTSSASPLGVWAVDLDGGNCRRLTPAVGAVHDFDPAWSPDGEWIVFASTRGTPGVGPRPSRARFEPQSDLWRMRADGSGVEQMTFLTNSELGPQFMREGRVTMTTEKVSAGFYQLAGRRINWDLTDYHPLLAQRAVSPYADPDDLDASRPSVGYQQATDIRERADGDFLVILSDEGARGGAGTLAIFNRSVGTMELGRADEDRGYLPSMTIVDPAATGRVGAGTTGAYRSPFGLPDGQILVSYTRFSGDLGTATSLDWDVVAIDPRTGNRTTLIGGAGAQVDAVLAVRAPPRSLYYNRRQLVFGGSVDAGLGDAAVLHIPDAPMVFTVLTGNLRRGRPVDAFRRARRLVVYAEDHAPVGTTSGNQADGRYEQRRVLGAVPLADDGSVKVQLPAGRGVVLELQDGDGRPVVTMGEEHQLGRGERISMGIVESLFDAVCGSCHGSITGSELDVTIQPDALTGASRSLSAGRDPVRIGN